MAIDLPTLLLDPIERRGVTLSRCPVPSHGKGYGDRNRSLQTRRGSRAWLVKCWAGCDLAEICQAMGLRISDLFEDTPLPRGSRPIPKPPRRPDRQQIAFQFELRGIVLQERAERTLAAAGGLDTSEWSDADFDMAMATVTRAYENLAHAHRLFDIADGLRERAFEGKT